MRAVLAPMLALFLLGCAQDLEPENEEAVEIFSGDLVALNGQSVSGSNLNIRLVSWGDEQTHYYIRGFCMDHGFLDPEDGLFWSGSTPAKNGEMREFLAERGRSAHCLVEDVARYHELIALMEEGASLAYGPDRVTATFTTSSNQTAEFRYQPNIFSID